MRFQSNILENNSDVYKELLNFDIKLDLRAFRAKQQFVAASILRLNNNLRDQELKFSEGNYKELRKNKATKSIKALNTIYKDEEIQSKIDKLTKNIERARLRTNELLELNEQLIKNLNSKLNKSDF
jgi:hypothetical protein